VAYKVVITKGDTPILTLSVEKRPVARAVALAAKENDLDCAVTKPAKEREVKFKGVE